MITGINLHNDINSASYFTYKSATTHVNISGATRRSNFAEINISDFRLWRAKSTFPTGDFLRRKSLQVKKR